MVRIKITKKRAVKKHQQIQELSGKEESEHDDRNPSEISSTVIQKTAVQALHTVQPSAALPVSTPFSQGSRVVHAKRLADVFTKLPAHPSAVEENDEAQHANASQSFTAKENLEVSHRDPPNKDKSANVAEVVEAEVEDAEMDQGEINKFVSNNDLQHTSYPREQQQRTMKFYFYPVESVEKEFKDEQAKPKPHKRRATRKVQTPATDELIKVLLWKHPSKKRTFKNLTDLEVAFAVFKDTVKDFSECASDRSILMLIRKFEEHFEQSILEKLQGIEAAQKMLQEINMLKKENKALSLNLGSLTDRRIKLQNEIASRRAKG